MVDPQAVDSPRKNWTLIDVLHGGEPGADWAMSLGRWKNDGEQAHPCLALRWNGSPKDDSKGSPTSRGYATWFIVPDDLAESLMSFVPANKLGLVKAMLGFDAASRQKLHDVRS